MIASIERIVSQTQPRPATRQRGSCGALAAAAREHVAEAVIDARHEGADRNEGEP
jgi:hypothetical protein